MFKIISMLHNPQTDETNEFECCGPPQIQQIKIVKVHL